MAAGFATKKATNFGNDRNIAHAGGKLDVSFNREHTFYQVQASRNKIEFGMYLKIHPDLPYPLEYNHGMGLYFSKWVFGWGSI